MDPNDAAERFLSGPLLAEVDDEARLALFRALKPDRAARGTRLIVQGRPNDRLWFLLEGSAVAVRADPDGAERPITRIEAPSIFGATMFFRPAPPSVTIRAETDVVLLTLDHAAHDRLRRDEPRAAEALALATVRALAERFDLLDQRFTEFLASHPDGEARANEWSDFRTRLFEEPNIL